ncbi:MAG: hypothetical protein EPN36_12990 [Rhodanobacteraceae bacterium]|nr:MAG: hypothetical protein EPN36_12990 [Rhodanobacteraceae bacterium]
MAGSFCGDHHRRWGAGQSLTVLFNFPGPLLDFQGPLSGAQRTALERAAAACPIHKLMTRTEIEIETVA